MAVMSRKIGLISGALALTLIAAVAVWIQHRKDENQLPYITQAGRDRLAYYDKQIAIAQTRGTEHRTDIQYVIELTNAVVARGKATGDGRDFENALAAIDDIEARIATRTRTDEGVTQLPELYAARARVMAACHRFIEARAIAEKALRKYPLESSLAAIAGEAAVQAGDLNGGEAYLRKLANSEGRVANNLIGLAYWAEISGDLEQAAELLKRAPEASFPKPLPRLRLAYVHAVQGDVQSKLGRLSIARQYYEASLKEEPTFAQARAGLADVARYEGKDDEAEKLLRDLVATEWPNGDYQVKLASLREARGDAAEAKQLRKAAENYFEWSVESGFDGYLRPLALLKLAKGEYKAAAKYAERDLALRPNSESKAIYQNIYDKAAAAGSALGNNALDQYRSSTASTVVAVPAHP